MSSPSIKETKAQAEQSVISDRVFGSGAESIFSHASFLLGTAMSSRPRPRPRPVAKHANAVNTIPSSPGTSSAETPSLNAVSLSVDDDDSMFMRNQSRDSKTWKKLKELDNGALPFVRIPLLVLRNVIEDKFNAFPLDSK